MRLKLTAGFLGTFSLAAASTGAVLVARYDDATHPTRVIAVLLALIAIHGMRYLRLWFSRELLLNLTFLGYSILTLCWTGNVRLATETLPSFVIFTLVFILFSALAAYHDLRALLCGMFAGFLAAAGWYSLTTGFPLAYPEDFSYNTIAGMYLIGIFITLACGAFFQLTILPIAIAIVLMVLLAATTSIKTNLGIALGLVASSILYFKFSLKNTLRDIIVVAAIGSAVVYGVISNQVLTDRVQNGFDRISMGVAVLTNREGDSGATGLGARENWKNEGLKGWATNPVFGYGIEGFRSEFGITSHSTPVDLLYNTGLIGCTLFYGILASIAWRLLTARDARQRNLRARMVIFLIAYSFMSLSGNVYYEPLLAIFVAVSSGMILRLEQTAAAEPTHVERSTGNVGISVSET
jgi:hypothetical protein